MTLYLLLNCIMLAIVITGLWLSRALKWSQAMSLTLGVLLAATAVFDSFIVALGIVAYDPQKILGITIGAAPVEDFFYAILTAVLIPNIWHRLAKEDDHDESH